MRYKAIENKGYPYTTMGYPDHVNALVVTYNKPYEAVICACYNMEIAEDIAYSLNVVSDSTELWNFIEDRLSS